MSAVEETAYAKINLALHIRARREDGYHELESVFAFCVDGDRLTATARDDGALLLQVEGPFAADLGSTQDNLVLRAARALQSAGSGQGADIILDKRLPIASGIGGGSADAAAALRLLIRLWNLQPQQIDLFTIAERLGADVPACLASHTMFVTGIGERLTPMDSDLAGTPILLVNPRLPCSTGRVFAGWDGMDRGPLSPDDWRNGRNDLEGSAIALAPEIADVLAALPGRARMSGSGATCFALFESAQDCAEAAARIRATHPGWWVMDSRLR